jgi:hypothetical protein
MDPVRIIKCLCGTFQSEIDMEDFTKKIALTSSKSISHSRGEAIIAKTGFLLGHNIDIERKVEFEVAYKPNKNSRNRWQTQVDVVFSNHEGNELALIEYETTDLIEDTVKSKINMWKCYFPNSNIKLLCAIVVNLIKKKTEQSWELKDRSELVNSLKIGFKEYSKDNVDNYFAIISLNDESINSYIYKEGKEIEQEYKANWK